MLAILDWVLARIGEPSTWRGIVAIIASFGLVMTPEQANAIVTVGLALVGLIEVFRREKK